MDLKSHKSLVDEGFREDGLLVLYTKSPKPKDGSTTTPIPEDFEEEIIDELKKIVILKGAIVYCGR